MWLPPVRQAARESSPDRDRLLDALRGGALIVVVLGHVAMAMVGWNTDGDPAVGNLLASSIALQVMTWTFQVIPLFFLAGGAANAMAWQRARARDMAYPAWMWGRIQRLFRPVLIYLAFLAIVATACTMSVGPASGPILALACQMLWFLGIYVMTMMLLPAMAALHHRNRWLAFVIGIPVAAGLNLGTTFWGWPLPVGFVNFLLVWLLVQQLGLFWTQQTRSWAWGVVLVVCLSLSITLVGLGPWPVSLVGIPGEAVSNMAPPSIVLMLHAGTLCSIAYLVRRPLTRWLHHPGPWLVAVTMSVTAMTVYLWHVPAMIASVLTLHALGIDPPTRISVTGYPEPVSLGGYAGWWLLFLGAFIAYLVLLVVIIWPAEHARLPVWDTTPRWLALPGAWPRPVLSAASGVGATMIGLATLVLSIIGFAGFPTAWVPWFSLQLNAAVALIVIVLGALLARSAAGRSETVGAHPARSQLT